MSGGMPELGSKISLISKADIRYEGRLYTVDPQECTIALSSVRSFGTEDRDTQFQIAPQSQIYDYILFRGSDIKDIRVINNSLPHPNDPAIMQVQLPNGQHLMPHFSMPNITAAQAQPLGAAGAYAASFGNMAGLGSISSSAGAVPSLAPGAGAPGPYMLGNQSQTTQQQQSKASQGPQSQTQQQQQSKQPNLLAGASRSTTPISLRPTKSPSADMAVQVNQQQSLQQLHNQQQQPQHHLNTNQQQQQQHYQQQQHMNQNNIAGGGHAGQSRDGGQHKRQNHQQQRGGNQRNNKTDYYHHQQQQQQQQQPQPQQQNNRRDRRDNSIRMMDYNNHAGGGSGSGSGANRNYNNRRGNNTGNTRSRGYQSWNVGISLAPKSGFRQIILPRNNKNPIKFEQDFDFEQANNKFEELRSQLSKLKVGDEPKSSEQINGETDKKDDSGNETGAGEHEPEEEEITVGYDKTKSFFDNISCEAAQDRTKNKGHDWRQERKLNSETFGVSSTRRGGYRGHSNYYNNRNMGGGYGGSGGYNRGYRGGNQYRNRSNNRNNHNNNNRDANTGISRSHNNGANLNNNSNNIMKNQTQQQQQQQPQQQQPQQQQQQPQLLGNMSNATNSVTVAPNPNSAPTISKSSSAGLSDNTKMIATVGAGQ
ncbi:LSM14 family protein trailer hitch isoform 2-T3 [Glossina fuscipes fuscipes]